MSRLKIFMVFVVVCVVISLFDTVIRGGYEKVYRQADAEAYGRCARYISFYGYTMYKNECWENDVDLLGNCLKMVEVEDYEAELQLCAKNRIIWSDELKVYSR